MPRVCHLAISLAPGGLEQLVVNWTNARNRREGGSTQICTLDSGGALENQVNDALVTALQARRGRFPWDGGALGRLRNVLSHVDIVHSHNLAAQQYAALACRRLTTRHIHTEHGSNPHTDGLINRWRLRYVGRHTDALVCVSRDTAQKMAPVWAVPHARIHVITNGVSAHISLSAAQQEQLKVSYDIAPGAFVIGSMGRLSREKRYDRLIRALAEMRSRAPARDIVLVLVGEGPERPALEHLAKSLNVEAHVRFCGYQARARDYLDIFDLFLLSSDTEGMPVALLEAMAAGCPVGVTDVGDCRDVIDDGRAGVLLPGDEDMWPECLLQWVSGDRQVRGRAVGRERVERHYMEATTLDAYERLYRRDGDGET